MLGGQDAAQEKRTDGERPVWKDSEVVLVGRFASMSRAEARGQLTRLGARWTRTPTPGTDVVIVGQAGPPLGRDGRPTQAMQRALALNEESGRPLILREEEWLADLGDESDDGPSLARLYTSEQLARILSVPAARIRAWVRQGLLEPARLVGRLAFFNFRDVASAKALDHLARAGVRAADIRRGLQELTGWLPETDVSLAQLEALEAGHLAVRLEDGQVAEPNGQLRMSFDEEPLPALPRREEPRRAESGRDAYERGLLAEESGDLEGAIAAYERAIDLDGPAPDVCFNLGNVLYTCGRPGDAAHRFLEAAESDAQFVEAWNNLGNVLAELGQTESAIRAYGCALEVAPQYPDAHYNLAEAYAASGDMAKARQHWRAYLTQDPFSRWARRVRERLARIEGILT